MLIRSIRHKGLRRLVELDDVSGVPAAYAAKLRKMITYLQDASDVGELSAIPTWKAHRLSGDRKGTWALHVSPNWRLTFSVDGEEIEIIDLDFEDYH
ncbi:MAG TPA: type II toxin-antitoxin system RelE/ParE family toxin [Devosia sp.]